MTESSVTNDKHESWIRECLIPTVIDRQQTANPTKKINLKNSTIKKFSNDGGYLITLCYKVIIVLNVDGDDNIISLFLKMSPEMSKEDCELLGFHKKFVSETIAYEDILPSLGSPEDFPKLYYSKTERFNEVIAISDFSADGFSMSKACVDLSLDHILVAMKALGKFHAASFALKFTERSRFDKLRKKLCNSALNDRMHPIFETVIKNGVARALNHFRQSDDAATVPEEFLKKLQHVMLENGNVFAYMESRANPAEPMAIICHGDFLRNNIAFAYDCNGLAINAMLFDFQTVLYASPMLDLCVFMANSTGHEIRQKHFDEIFRTYYDAVIAHFLDITALNANGVPDYMSYDGFLREYVIQMPFGFLIAAQFLPILHASHNVFGSGSFEDAAEALLTLGGAAVDGETHAQIIEMYELHKKFNLTLLDDA